MERILVALDSTDNASFVLSRAVEHARGVGSKLRLVTAVQLPPPVAGPAMGQYYFADPGAIIELAEASLAERARVVPPSMLDGMFVRVGPTWEVVRTLARAYDADLVVIGAHRHGLIARMLGTTAASIVNHLDRSVLVIRPEPPRATAQASAPLAESGATVPTA